MQEHLSKDAKKAVATPLMSHMATPSSFPHPGEPWLDDDRILGSTELALGLKKLVQLVVLVVAAMNWRSQREREREREMSNKGAATVTESFPMNGGDGTYSYTKNSQYQRIASSVVKEMIEEAISENLDIKSLTSKSNTLCIADLGCSVGPNTFFAMQNVLQAIEKKFHSQTSLPKNPEFQVFFNDHVGNDFNTLFNSLPSDGKYFAAGVPGTFHSRLFPESSLHFVHSSYALQWLSKVPDDLLDFNSRAWNKGKIHYTSASEEVANAYATQHRKDMEVFLEARGKEIVVGGLMVLTLQALPDGVHHSQLPAGLLFDFLGSTLINMVKEGLVDEAQVDSFNLPVYAVSAKEMTLLVEKNGCFSIEIMELMDPRSKIDGPVDMKKLIMHLRAGMEGVFTKHFGYKIVDEMFEKAIKKSSELSELLDLGYKKGTQLFLVLKRK